MCTSTTVEIILKLQPEEVEEIVTESTTVEIILKLQPFAVNNDKRQIYNSRNYS